MYFKFIKYDLASALFLFNCKFVFAGGSYTTFIVKISPTMKGISMTVSRVVCASNRISYSRMI